VSVVLVSSQREGGGSGFADCTGAGQGAA